MRLDHSYSDSANHLSLYLAEKHGPVQMSCEPTISLQLPWYLIIIMKGQWGISFNATPWSPTTKIVRGNISYSRRDKYWWTHMLIQKKLLRWVLRKFFCLGNRFTQNFMYQSEAKFLTTTQNLFWETGLTLILWFRGLI